MVLLKPGSGGVVGAVDGSHEAVGDEKRLLFESSMNFSNIVVVVVVVVVVDRCVKVSC